MMNVLLISTTLTHPSADEIFFCVNFCKVSKNVFSLVLNPEEYNRSDVIILFRDRQHELMMGSLKIHEQH